MIDKQTKEKIMGKLAGLTGSVLYSLVTDDTVEEDDQEFGDIANLANANEYMYGRSKLVLIYNDIDSYVVKIPIKKHMIDENTVEEYDCAYLKEPCENANDYCLLEEKVYQKACEHQIEDMFAGTWHIGDIDGYPIYASEMVDYTFDDIDDELEDEVGFVNRDCKETDEDLKSIGRQYRSSFIEYQALDLMLQKYGLERMDKLFVFMSEMTITDLHSGNIGFNVDGTIKIIDYPGFYN